jgi:hypothetical protein
MDSCQSDARGAGLGSSRSEPAAKSEAQRRPVLRKSRKGCLMISGPLRPGSEVDAARAEARPLGVGSEWTVGTFVRVLRLDRERSQSRSSEKL